MHETIAIYTRKNREIIDITNSIQKFIDTNNLTANLCHISVLHTTAAITTADLDPETDQDYLSFIEKATPLINWKHPHDPSHTPVHIWSAVIGTQLMLPVKDGKLVLGTWQRIVLIELSGPRERTILVTLV